MPGEHEPGRPRLTVRQSALAAAVILIVVPACTLSFGDLDPVENGDLTLGDDAINFLVLGDWGRNGWFQQRAVARRLGETATDIDAQFVLTTGDNFYDRGVPTVSDGQWNRSYESVYTAPSLQIPWFVTLGNHDHLGSVDAQIAYSEVSDRWTLPARYYSFTVSVNDTTAALFAMIDTVPLVDGQSASTPPEDVAETGAANEWDAERQLVWLDSTLAVSDAEWRFVVGHHPLYAADGKHRDYPKLRETVGPIIERRGVDVYIAGHVHSLQHLEPEATDVHHVVSGAGSLASRIDRGVAATFAAGVAGFAVMSLASDALSLAFVDHKGTVGYSTTIEPRGESAPQVAGSPLGGADG